MSITVNALARIKRMQSDQNARCSRTFSITDTGKRLVSFVLRHIAVVRAKILLNVRGVRP